MFWNAKRQKEEGPAPAKPSPMVNLITAREAKVLTETTRPEKILDEFSKVMECIRSYASAGDFEALVMYDLYPENLERLKALEYEIEVRKGEGICVISWN